MHPALASGNVALVSGGASGIGLAAAKRFAGLGMSVCIVDLGDERLAEAREAVADEAAEGAEVAAFEVNVARLEAVARIEEDIRARFGGVDVLMNNAGVQPGSDVFGPRQNWQHVIDVNLWGIVNVAQTFVPAMIERGREGLVINTGSKQGITTPPGDPAYNVAKAGVKAFSEALQHDLRNREGCRVEARMLIPGFVFTPLTRPGESEKPDAAWTPEQTIDFMFERLDADDFYILCPDNDVTRRLDERRILWAAGDIAENRPPLSRWHPDYAAAFDAFVDEG
ncbi:SDR family NAD(P)-dependent oxidoreductase [Pararhizobium mangrovi]|uniref:SDR family NAD(P)-dependent oxidoreductase n=1 Tax=Pararhizobium mangrovi TaxID=2590452 RepID=A0A506UHQ5_9HYPH|nr:SDR family NAD(P)-dependent oxidoreductase [Pararhizobium mangrovi]TPW32842.1 SDR family NAD(P)-dependent oxidoreductase [Pararhizobium mangrovi]